MNIEDAELILIEQHRIACDKLHEYVKFNMLNDDGSYELNLREHVAHELRTRNMLVGFRSALPTIRMVEHNKINETHR
jgi:hypothetical protein